MTKAAGLFLLLLCVQSLSAQAMPGDIRMKISAEVQRCIATDGAPSASVAIVQDGVITYAEAFGKASLSPAVAATTATRYQLASLSKTYTAQAILQLEAAGKLSLDDTVARWYPGLSGADRITLRQLLSHTAGYGNFYPTHYPAGPRGRAIPPDSIIEEWGKHPLLFEPGTRFSYSNLAYEMAARIVEKVSGQPFFAYLQQHVLKPAGMESALDLDTIPADSPLLATGYVREALGKLEPAEYEGPGWSFGAGQVVTTARDVAQADIALLMHNLLPPAQALAEVTPVRLTDGQAAPTALGLFVDQENGVRRYYHSGQGLGFLALNMIYPDQQLAIVVLVNTSATETTIKIADSIAYLLLPASSDDLFARNIFAQLQAGTLDPALLTTDLQSEWTHRHAQIFAESLGKLGAVTSFIANRTNTVDALETRTYDITAGGHALKLGLLLVPGGKLEDVYVTAAR